MGRAWNEDSLSSIPSMLLTTRECQRNLNTAQRRSQRYELRRTAWVEAHGEDSRGPLESKPGTMGRIR